MRLSCKVRAVVTALFLLPLLHVVSAKAATSWTIAVSGRSTASGTVHIWNADFDVSVDIPNATCASTASGAIVGKLRGNAAFADATGEYLVNRLYTSPPPVYTITIRRRDGAAFDLNVDPQVPGLNIVTNSGSRPEGASTVADPGKRYRNNLTPMEQLRIVAGEHEGAEAAEFVESSYYVAPGITVHETVGAAPEVAPNSLREIRKFLAGGSRSNRTLTSLTNGDFESGDFTGWSLAGAYGDGAPSACGAPRPAEALITSPGLLPLANEDPCIDAVYHGQHAAQLGDEIAWGFDPAGQSKCNTISQDAVVPAGTANLTFAYAVIAANPGHGFGDDPYFNVRLEDVTSATVLYDLTDYTTSYDPSDPCNPWLLGATYGGQIVYRCWTEVSLDLSGIAGHTVRLSLKASDCSPSGHFCEAFLDGVGLACPDYTPPELAPLSGTCEEDPTDPGSFCANIGWLAPSDPSSGPDVTGAYCVPVVQAATTYDVRWSTLPIVDEAGFAAATQVLDEPTPGAPGTPQSLSLCGLPGTNVFVALRSLDASFNASALSSVEVAPGVPCEQVEVVGSDRKISDTEGGFGPALLDHDHFATALAAIGDVDGDGTDDMAVTTLGQGGAVRVLFMNDDGTVASVHRISDGLGGFPSSVLDAGDRFGAAVVSLGDPDGPGPIAVTLAVGAPGDDDGGPQTSWFQDPVGGHWYKLTNRRYYGIHDDPPPGSGNDLQPHWLDAVDDAAVEGAYLFVIKDHEEEVFVRNAFGTEPMWLGLTDYGHEGVWQWVRADGTTAINWDNGQPDNAGGGGEDCAHINHFGGPGTVNDLGNHELPSHPYYPYRAVFERDSPPPPPSDRGAVWILNLDQGGVVQSYQKVSEISGGLGESLTDGDEFGGALAAIGDLDGDGSNDLAVAAVYDDDGGPNRGAVWILFLAPDGTVRATKKVSANAGMEGVLQNDGAFGWCLAGLGELGSTGLVGLAVGAHVDDDGGCCDRGAVWVLHLDPDGVVRERHKLSATNCGLAELLNPNDYFGSSLAAGDFDADGAPDLLVGAVGDDDGGELRGAAWLVLLNSNGTAKCPQKISDLAGGFDGVLEDGDYFGSSVASLGDYNHDGAVDFGIGAPRDDDGGTDRGAVWILSQNSVFRVATVDPLPNSTGSGWLPEVTIDFTRRVNPADVTPANFSITGTLSGPAPSSLVAEAAGRTVKILPGWDSYRTFSAGERVEVVVTRMVRSADGLTIQTPNVTNFRTLAQRGDGTFTPLPPMPAGSSVVGAAAGDLNGDWKPDLVTVGTDGKLTLFLNTTPEGGQPSWQQSVSAVGNSFASVALWDLDLDGELDIIASDQGLDLIRVGLNGGGAMSWNWSTWPAGDAPQRLAVGEINGDGHPDVAVCHEVSNDVHVLLGDGAGGVLAIGTYPVAANPFDLDMRDLDLDGALDLVVLHGTSEQITVLRNVAPTAAPGAIFSVHFETSVPGAQGVLVEDINGDRHPDVLVATANDGQVAVLLTRPDATLAPPVHYATGTGGSIRGLAPLDFDGDGDQDLGVTNPGSNEWILLRNDGGEFTVQLTSATLSRPILPLAADVNRDGVLDLVVPTRIARSVEVYMGNRNVADVPEDTDTVRQDGMIDLAVSPNPSSATMFFALRATGTARLEVFDAGGRIVRRFDISGRSDRSGVFTWDATDRFGRPVPAGLYFARLRQGDRESTVRFVRVQ